MPIFFSKLNTLKEQPQFNILYTREVDTDFGDLQKAMKAVGFKLKYVAINYDVKETLSQDKEKKLKALKGLQHTLNQGQTVNIPPYISKHVIFYEQALLKDNINGIFSPPTMNGVLFNSMITHLPSHFDKEEAADDSSDEDINKLYNSLLNEASIILAARRLNIPVLGSCHGAQLLWYMHGGDLYSIPDYSVDTDTGPIIEEGSVMNAKHEDVCNYDITLNEDDIVEADYTSDSEEEDDKDYEHNLLMAVSKKKWINFNAKEHPLTKQIEKYFTLVPQSLSRPGDMLPSFPDNATIAKSFEFPGCIATQWHPHAYLDTKSSIRYLRSFASQCIEFKEHSCSRPFSKMLNSIPK